MLVAYVLGAVFAVRLVHRLYYVIVGHEHQWPSYSPRAELEELLQRNLVPSTEHNVQTKDGVLLRYRILGKGRRLYLLANGVGTDFFMWLPIFHFLLSLRKTLFDDITLIVPNYRGLFEPNDDKFARGPVSITIDNCVEDICLIMKDAQLKALKGKLQDGKVLDGLIGWSTGAQVGLELAAKHPKLVKKLFLLNPACGSTLHTALQPFAPLPHFVGKFISQTTIKLITYLKGLIPKPLWNQLKVINDSIFFHMALTTSAFLGGFPPEQPVFFHEYMRDVFKTRSQTRALFDLILCLDEPMSKACFTIPQQTTLVSGTPDFMTGVYHSTRLAKTLPKVKHINFTMGSHFVLLEWPDLIAKEMLVFLETD